MSRDLVLRLNGDQAFILHQLLRRAEDLAVNGDDFERLGTQGSEFRRQFISLQVEVDALNKVAMRRR